MAGVSMPLATNRGNHPIMALEHAALRIAEIGMVAKGVELVVDAATDYKAPANQTSTISIGNSAGGTFTTSPQVATVEPPIQQNVTPKQQAPGMSWSFPTPSPNGNMGS